MKGLVAGFLENISSVVFDHYLSEITTLIGKQHGVYALYKRGRLYYVGLATDLRGRVKYHLKDRHAKKWDTFSLYLITRAEHLRELETLVVHIAGPKGNVQAGKFWRSRNLKHALKGLLRQRVKVEHEKILSLEPKPGKASKARQHIKRHTLRAKIPMAGLLPTGTQLRVVYKKKQYTATVEDDGRIKYDGKIFNSPSSAGSTAKGGKATDGWFFWKYQAADGKWVYIDLLRKKRPSEF